MLLSTRALTSLDRSEYAALADLAAATAACLDTWTLNTSPALALERPEPAAQVAVWALREPGQGALVVAAAAVPPVLFDLDEPAADLAVRLRRTLIPNPHDVDRARWARLGQAATVTLASPEVVVEETSTSQAALSLPAGPDGWVRCRLAGSGASGEFRFLPAAGIAALAAAAAPPKARS